MFISLVAFSGPEMSSAPTPRQNRAGYSCTLIRHVDLIEEMESVKRKVVNVV